MKKTFRFLALGVMLIAGVMSSFADPRPADGPADGDYVGANVSGGVVNYVVTGWDAVVNAYTVQIDGLDYDGLNPAGGAKITELTIKTSFSQKWKTFKYNFYVEKIIDTDATAKKAFYAMTQLTKLVFESDEDAVKAEKFTFSVGNYAFYGCTKLATLTLPNNVNKIGIRAFQNTAITSFVIPAKCKTIGANAFYNTQKLATVTVSEAGNNELTVLGKQVFANSAVSTLNLENATALTEIEDGAFIYELSDVNYQLKNVTLPKKIENAAHERQYGADNTHKHYVSNFTKINTAFANCTGLTTLANLEVSEVVDFNDGAFLNCEKLTVLNLPATAKLNHVTKSPFQGCKGLATLTFACCWKGEIASDLYLTAGLTEAQQAAELGYLKKLEFKGRVYGAIDASAFGNADVKKACSGLTEVKFNTIYEGTSIGNGAFQNCAALATLTFENGFIGDVKEKTNTKTITIGSSAFAGTALAAVDFKTIAFNSEDKKCEFTIAREAFACDNLASVTFGKITYAKKVANALIIKDRAFVSDKLETVNFACKDNEGIIAKDAQGVLTIGEGVDPAFAPATASSTGALKTVKFGKMQAGAFEIKPYAFRSEALTWVEIGDVTTDATATLTIGKEAFGYLKALGKDSHANEKTVKIGKLTQNTSKALAVTIGDAAFFGDKLQLVQIGEISAQQVVIGTAAASKDDGAFGGNLAEKAVIINGLVKNDGNNNSITINKYAFYGDKLQGVLIGSLSGTTPVPAKVNAATVKINDNAFAGVEMKGVVMGDIESKTEALFGPYSFANMSVATDKVKYDYVAKLGNLNSDKLTIKATAFQGAPYDGSTFTVTAGNVKKAPAAIEANAFVAPAVGVTSYTMGDIEAGTFDNVAGGAFVGSLDEEGKNATDVKLGALKAEIPKPSTWSKVDELTIKSWNATSNFWRWDGVRILTIENDVTAALYGDGTMNTIEEITIGGDVTASTIASFGKKVRKVMFTKNNAKIPAGVIVAGTFQPASDAAKNDEKIVVRYFVDEDNAILSNQIFNIKAFGGDDAYTNVELYCSAWQKANTFENTDIIGAPGHIYRMQFSSSDIIPGEPIEASCTVQEGGKYAYGRLYIPAGTNNYYKVSAQKTDDVNTVNVFSATVDGADIYMKPVDIQDGCFWIDATAVDQVFVVRTSNISAAVDGKVALTVEPVDADEAADFVADGGYFFDASDAKKNALQYVKQTVINTELQNTAPYKDKGIYVMANPKTRGLAFAWLDQFGTSRDLTAGNVYVLTKKTAAARLNVIFEGDDEFDVESNANNEATGIKSVESEADNDTIFNLQGVRVNNAEKGIFIINGKKVVK